MLDDGDITVPVSGCEINVETGDPRLILEKHSTDGSPASTEVRFKGEVIARSERRPDGAALTSFLTAAKPGRENEDWAADTLRAKLAEEWGVGVQVDPGDDRRGDDRVLSGADGRRVGLQLTMPDTQDDWKQRRTQGPHAVTLDVEAAVQRLRQSILRKSEGRGAVQLSTQILGLDCQFLASFADLSVATTYLGRHGSPEQEFGWREVWLIAPTTPACRRLSAA